MGSIEWVGDTFLLEDVSELLPRGVGSYRTRGAGVEEIIFHQTAGGTHQGLAGPRMTATFHSTPTAWATKPDGTPVLDRRGRRVACGGGKGWPGIAYHFLVPYLLESDGPQGKHTVYRTQSDGAVSYHTGGSANRRGVGVALQGLFASRHAVLPGAKDGPSAAQVSVLEELVEYLGGRYGMGDPSSALRGHFDYGKPACPGDAAEQWLRSRRGEEFTLQSSTAAARVDLSTWKARERALWLVGQLEKAPDGLYDYDTRAAVERFQSVAGIVVDGVWGRQTQAAMLVALRDQGRHAAVGFFDRDAQPSLWTGR